MKHRAALLLVFAVILSGVSSAQPQEFARLLRNGEQATLSVFGGRPVALAAKKLVDEFGVSINVEDLVSMYRDDFQDITPPRVASSAKRSLVPRASLLELRLDLRPDGSLRDVRQVLADLVETANAQLPFAYRLDKDGDSFTLVATRTRDEQGRSIDLIPILDRHITITLGARHFQQHAQLLTGALEEQTGFHIGCCSAAAESQPGPFFTFGADDEPARIALLRLLRSRPARYTLVLNGRGHAISSQVNREVTAGDELPTRVVLHQRVSDTR